MELTYFGHSCFSVKIKGKYLLFDPFIRDNELAKHIEMKDILADYIFISHGHADHMADAVELAHQTGALVISCFEIINWLSAKGVKNIHPMNIGGKKVYDFGVVKCVNAIHSSQLPDGSYGGNPMGFVIMSEEGNFYFSGDTALTLDMNLIGKMGKIDFSVLPIGDNFTMDAADAAQAALLAGTKKTIGVHYDTFGYIKIDKKEAGQIFKEQGVELILPEIGQCINI